MKKFLENIWYHYKIYLLLALIIVGLAVIMIVGLVNKKTADLQVIVYTKASLSSVEIKQLEDSFISKIDDYNMDGKIIVDIIPINYNSSATDAMKQKLLVEMTQGKAYLVLSEEEGVRDILNYSAIIQNVSAFDSRYVRFDNRALLVHKDSFMPFDSNFFDDDFYLFLRDIDLNDEVRNDLCAVVTDMLNYSGTADK